MRKITGLLVVFMVMLVPISAAQEDDDPALKGAAWLLTQQNDDGSFGDSTNAGITALVAVALANVELPNAAALSWLETYVSENAETLSLSDASTITDAVVVSGGDPATFAEGVLVEAHTRQFEEAGGADITGLCESLLAQYNLNQALPADKISDLVALQNGDGGFGVFEGAPTDTLVTSVCVQSLALTTETDALQNALAFLESVQNEDGGWGLLDASLSDGVGTGFVAMSLVAAGEDLTAWNNPDALLLSFQDAESGMIAVLESLPELNMGATALSIMVFQGKTIAVVSEE